MARWHWCAHRCTRTPWRSGLKLIMDPATTRDLKIVPVHAADWWLRAQKPGSLKVKSEIRCRLGAHTLDYLFPPCLEHPFPLALLESQQFRLKGFKQLPEDFRLENPPPCCSTHAEWWEACSPHPQK